jgi:urease accessory protein
MGTPITTTMTATRIDAAAAARLLCWLSPAFPVGGYTHSHGLEWAIGAGDVTDAATLADWLSAVLHHGAGRSDAILLAHAHRAAHDAAVLAELDALAAALCAGRERWLESRSQGGAFALAVGAVWPDCAVALPEDACYPVAVGAAAARAGLGLPAVLGAFLHGFAAMVVSAGVRAIPLGQTDGLRVLAALEPAIAALARDAASASLDDIGGCAFRADLASIRHETQTTRLFRT